MHDLTYVWNLKMSTSQEQRVEQELWGGGGGGHWSHNTKLLRGIVPVAQSPVGVALTQG